VTVKTTTPMIMAAAILRTGDRRDAAVAGLNNSSSVSVWLESSPYSRSSFSSSMVEWQAQGSSKRVWARPSGFNVPGRHGGNILYAWSQAVPSLGVALLVADHGSVMYPRTDARPP